MWINQLSIINYKSCRNLTVEFSKDEPNVLIGINDCGKSTVLKALGLLISPKPSFNFPLEDKKKNDLSNSRISLDEFKTILDENNLPLLEYDGKQTIVIGKIILEKEDVDEAKLASYSPQLQWTIDNLQDRTLWLARTFNESNQSCVDLIISKDVIEDSRPLKLYSETAKNLQERAKNIGLVKGDIENENKAGRFKNIEYVNAIYKKSNLSDHWVEYSIKDEKNFFPEYSYLDWNVSMEQLQQVAKSAISNKITPHTESAIDFARKQAQEAQKIVDEELESFTKQFATDLPNIESFKSNIIFSVESKLTDILINKTNTHGDIHLDSQGDGVKRQIWFALIKWSALNALDADINNKKFIWCFDEPETHLYPKAQRDFFQIIKQVSSKNIQSVISTHSTTFIDRSGFEKILKFELKDGYSKVSKCSKTADVFEALQIRNSDFLFYDKFLVVEGDTEEILIPHLFKLYSGDSLNSKGIQLINLGGKDKRKQNKQLLKVLLKDFNKDGENIVYIFDNDVTFEMTTAELSELVFFPVGKQDVEDSISSKVWGKIIEDKFSEHNISLTIEEIEEIKSNITNAEKINSNQKFYPKLKNQLKQKLGNDNRYLVDDLLPDKGKSSGQLLIDYIPSIELVDSSFKKAFELLLKP